MALVELQSHLPVLDLLHRLLQLSLHPIDLILEALVPARPHLAEALELLVLRGLGLNDLPRLPQLHALLLNALAQPAVHLGQPPNRLLGRAQEVLIPQVHLMVGDVGAVAVERGQ